MSPPPRQDLGSRLDSLVKDSPNMPPKRLSILRQQSVSAPASPSTRFRYLSEDTQPQPPSPSSGPASPILRWFHTQISSPSPPPLSRPQTPHSAALTEAIHDHLPTRPEPAHLATECHTKIRPPILNELTRSTLPTSSLSIPANRLGHHTPDSTQALLLNRIPPSAPARTSLDTLRTLYTKATPTTPLHQQTRSINIPASFRNWFRTEPAKEDDKHESILTEEDQDDDPEVEQENLRKKYLAPKHPVVFCHGLLGFDSVTIGPAIAPLEVTHWRGIKEVLQSNGVDVLITRVPATSSPVDRALVLAKRISEVYPGRKIHLIGHSMGGLDCRYLTTHLVHRNFSVLSVTTIATPHRGSAFADYFLETVGQARLPQVLALLDMLPIGGGDGKAFEFLTTENMKKFNERTPDVEGVKYFSYGAEYDPGLIDTWKFPHSVVLEKEGPNDGLVSIMSARWGTYLGTLEHVNHLDLVGWINTARYKWAELMGNEIKFKPATFYLGIVDYLAKAVEGLKPDDADEERGGGAKRGHGEIVDGVSQGETNMAPRVGEGVASEVHPAKDPLRKLSTMGKDKDEGQSSSFNELGVTPNHGDKATERLQESGPDTNFRFIPTRETRKPDNDER
ncbi:Alpha/Beta hydrolase protein [Thelephora terrestris]|uniref:GPI inositol-deacylase n=1 Tax=Thelephora terrestris TaxID=56493 RepID=A0A9P6HGV4_9AGAM|nr:Alpha/Beta hydrolase protein [Thelephora terrestris]